MRLGSQRLDGVDGRAQQVVVFSVVVVVSVMAGGEWRSG